MKNSLSPNRKLNTSEETSQNNSESDFPKLHLKQIFLYSILGGAVWLSVVALRPLGTWVGIFFFLLLLLITAVLLLEKRPVDSLTILIYLAVIQPIPRTYIHELPYLILEYFFLGWSLLFVALNSKRGESNQAPLLFYSFYLVLEVIGLLDANNLQRGRSTLISSMSVGAALLLLGRINLNKKDLSNIFSSTIIGALNILFIIAYKYAISPSIQWGAESNFSASGGMGPVQISMLLALGVIMLLIFLDKKTGFTRIVYLLIAAILATGMILTFSRNGLYLIAIAVICYYFLFKRPSAQNLIILLGIALFSYIVYYFSYQAAGSAFINRFTDTGTTNRIDIALAGWNIFLDNPFTGVGTSNFSYAVSLNNYFGSFTGSHNELIRAAAEHGIFGLVSWLLFTVTALWSGFTQKKGNVRAFKMSLLAIFFAYLFVNGLKLMIQPLILIVALSIDEF